MRQRKDVFLSYSRQDVKWRDLLYRHLRPLEKTYDCRIWSDVKIESGTQWQQEITAALASTRVAVLLLSADFLNSDFIANNELPPLLQAAQEEGTIILPLIIKPCAFARTKNISQFQAVNEPAKPLINLSEGEQEEILDQLANRIEELLNREGGEKFDYKLSRGVAKGVGEMVTPQAESRQDSFEPNTSSGLNPLYTFASYVEGGSNQFAYAAAWRVAKNPSSSYNPLFLYGGVGLGKTHLLHAIGHEIIENQRGLCVLYLTAQQFIDEVIEAIRFDRLPAFHGRYHTIDVLMIDDVQFVASKKRSQEELFHVFNILYNRQRQIILSSDSSPRNIPNLEERLLSRFEWGLIADIQPPGLETKIAILQRKASLASVELPEEVAEFIAQQVKSNVRELEGLLTRVIAYSVLTSQPLSPVLARKALKDLLPEEAQKPAAAEIIRFVARYYDLKISEIKSRSTSRQIVFPRQVAMYLCRRLTDLSYPEIGKIFNDMHHSSVMYSAETVQKKRDSDPALDQTLRSFELHLS